MNRIFFYQFGAAFLAAPVVWAAMAWMFPSDLHPGHALAEPLRLLMLAGLYPLLEELVFRGALQGWLRDAAWGLRCLGPLSAANLLSSLAFTSLHFIFHPPITAVLVFAPSLVFGYFRDRTDGDRTCGLGAPMMLHCSYNAGYFLFFGI